MFISATSFFYSRFLWKGIPCRYVFESIKIFIPELILNYILCKAKTKSDMNM